MKKKVEDVKKLFDNITNAVVSEAMLPENLQDDIKKICQIKITKNSCSELRKTAMFEFKCEMDGCFEELKQNMNLEEVDNKLEEKRLKKSAWRMNLDPEHNTFAQRYKGYDRFIKECREEIAGLREDVQTLREELTGTD
ncbi:unnamed protein product [Bursaphelenchus okinawaensis]|uniref:Uncharacterized protein n=1 Tax=Bursaphelenchus okinawaensis TaxID=465554 RepID=A0A811LNT5_9BILA|nr:unnamed protein product [Bursaphelenchus okinawaensis]CAG9126622.1 unnamed protein product [Bursaphelenchus okinawaensis]